MHKSLNIDKLCRGAISFDLKLNFLDLDLTNPYNLEEILNIASFNKDYCVSTKNHYIYFIRSIISNFKVPVVLELKCLDQEYVFASFHKEFLKSKILSLKTSSLFFLVSKYDKKYIFLHSYDSGDFIKISWIDLPLFLESVKVYDKRVFSLFNV